MTAYVDTSVLLRLILGERKGFKNLLAYDELVSSELLAVESRRTIDRLRAQGALTSEDAVTRLELVAEWLEAIDLVLLRPAVLSRAGDPLPTPLGTLDALHLATALVWRDRTGLPLVVATHDAALGLAGRSFGFEIVGV